MEEGDNKDVMMDIIQQMNREKPVKKSRNKYDRFMPQNQPNSSIPGASGTSSPSQEELGLNKSFSDDDEDINEVPMSPPRVGPKEFPSQSPFMDVNQNMKSRSPFMARCVSVKSPDDFYIRTLEQESKMGILQVTMDSYCDDDEQLHPMTLKAKDQILVYSLVFDCWCRAIFERYATLPKELPVIAKLIGNGG